MLADVGLGIRCVGAAGWVSSAALWCRYCIQWPWFGGTGHFSVPAIVVIARQWSIAWFALPRSTDWNPEAYFRHALERVANHAIKAIAELLSWHMLAQVPSLRIDA